MFIVKVIKNNQIINAVLASSKYDAKQRKSRMAEVFPDCSIEIGICDGTEASEASIDGKGIGV